MKKCYLYQSRVLCGDLWRSCDIMSRIVHPNLGLTLRYSVKNLLCGALGIHYCKGML